MFGVVFLPRWLKQINRRSIKKCHAIWHVVHRISSKHVVECNKWAVGCCIHILNMTGIRKGLGCLPIATTTCTHGLVERGRQGREEKTCELTSSANVADTCNVSAALLKSRLTGQKKLAKATARRRRRHRSFVLLAPHHCVHSVVGSDVLVRRSYSIVASSRKEQKSLARLYFYILL